MTRTSFRAALTAALMLGATALCAPALAASAPKVSSGVAKALSDVQKANAAKDFVAAQAGIDKAKAVSDRTPYDDLMIARFAMSVHINTKDFAAADVDAEAAADMDPSVIPDTDKLAVYKPALQLALANKHYDKAVKYTHILQAMTPPPDAETQGMFPQALFLGGDKVGAAELAKKNIAAAKAAGAKPTRNDLDILMGAQVQTKDEAGAEDTLEALVANYNEPDDWNQIIGVSFGTKGIRDIDVLYLGRLMFLASTKPTAQDASLVGQNASHLGFYGDVIQAEKLGGTGFTPPEANAAADKKTIPQQISAGAKQGGQYNVKLAEALYGYGMYPEAEAAARLAQQKGGATDPSEAPMMIAISLAAQGKYADAQTAFGQVTGGSPATPRILRLWGYYVKSKQAPATAAQ